MNPLVFTVILLFSWIVFIAINRGFFIDKASSMPRGAIDNLGNSPAPTIRDDLGIKNNDLQNQIRSELYNSISTGMTYEEVSSIIGWEGVLIYENEDNDGGKIIRTKVYQWNYDDIYSHNTVSADSARARIINPYKNLTLEFQDNILIEQTFSELKP
ncbi:hypothetical protein IQ255_28745 [Pleurocapsales cyanobacterium LEGE 10410]|nr:hypothetical protein [Pleurocapsales cyanobacterium LEGE 10410]